jgi:hypothetical protein
MLIGSSLAVHFKTAVVTKNGEDGMVPSGEPGAESLGEDIMRC